MAAPYFGSGYWGGLGGGGFLSPTSGPPPGGTVTATWTPPADVVTEGYRYLRLRCRAAVAGNITVQLVHSEGEDKTYTLAVGTTYADREIDLCFPDTRPDDIDPQQSRWPLKGFGLPPENSRQHWGFNQFEQMVITVDASLAPLEIDEIALVRRDHGRGSILPAFSPWQTAWVATGVDTTSQKAFWWSDADGRHSDRAAVFKITPISGPVNYNFYSITDTLGQMATPRGWVLTAGGPFPSDGYHTNSLPGLLLGGGGVRYDWGPPGAWVHEIDRDYDAPRDVFAQALWHEVQVYPQAGDVWRGAAGDYGVATPLRTAKVMRALAWGLTFTGSGPKAGQLVRFDRHPSGISSGTGLSDVRGEYLTGPSFGPPANHRVKAGALETPTFAAWARYRHRRCFIVPTEAGGGSWCIHSPWSEFHVLTAAPPEAESFAITHRRRNLPVPVGGFDATTVVGSFGRARIGNDSRGNGIMMVAEHDGNVVALWSYDDGLTYSTPMALITNSWFPTINEKPTGEIFVAAFRYDSGTSGPGTIVGRYRYSGESAFSAEFTFKDSAGNPIKFEPETFHFCAAPEGPDRWLLTCKLEGETGVRVLASADDGLTWTVIV